jgi:hypothetical protein
MAAGWYEDENAVPKPPVWQIVGEDYRTFFAILGH